MIEKIRKDIIKHNMLNIQDVVVLAVSGGPDSIALLKILEILSVEFNLTLVAAHLNHGIRGDEADQEEQFVMDMSQDIGIVFECQRVHVPFLKNSSRMSIEEIARQERYRFLTEVAKKHNAQKIALGHHLNDQAETVIINFLRGSGTDGLKGMLPVRDGMFIRPFLGINREEILRFLGMKRIPFMLDSSNDEDLYLRNRIRHYLLPELKKRFNPNIEENLRRMSEIFRLDDDYMRLETSRMLEKLCVSYQVSGNDSHGHSVLSTNNESENGCLNRIHFQEIKISQLRQIHSALQMRIIKKILDDLSPSGKGIGHVHVQAVMQLMESNKPCGYLNLPNGIQSWREYDLMRFGNQKVVEHVSTRHTLEPSEGFFYKIPIPGLVHIRELGIDMNFELLNIQDFMMMYRSDIAYIDYAKIVHPLVLRPFAPGDRIHPLGMVGEQKVKKYFIDKKIPRRVRKEIPLLIDGHSTIWIAGMRLSEHVKITNETRVVLKVEII